MKMRHLFVLLVTLVLLSTFRVALARPGDTPRQQVGWASPTIKIAKCPLMIHGSNGFEFESTMAM
jgi:hypothetical protein